MQKINQAGFSVVEVVLLLVVVSIIGAVGVFTLRVRNNSHKVSPAPSSNSAASTAATATPKTEANTKTSTSNVSSESPYKFKELGIQMDLLAGWQVKATTGTDQGHTTYNWIVENPSADGKIAFSSTFFQGGFTGCDEDSSGLFAKTTVTDVAQTKNDKLMFMSWNYTYGGETSYNSAVVSTSGGEFYTAPNMSAPTVKDKNVKPGTYYLCLGLPTPGFDLGLSQHDTDQQALRDTIYVLAAQDKDGTPQNLSPSAKSYADIKKMLASIK